MDLASVNDMHLRHLNLRTVLCCATLLAIVAHARSAEAVVAFGTNVDPTRLYTSERHDVFNGISRADCQSEDTVDVTLQLTVTTTLTVWATDSTAQCNTDTAQNDGTCVQVLGAMSITPQDPVINIPVSSIVPAVDAADGCSTGPQAQPDAVTLYIVEDASQFITASFTVDLVGPDQPTLNSVTAAGSSSLTLAVSVNDDIEVADGLYGYCFASGSSAVTTTTSSSSTSGAGGGSGGSGTAGMGGTMGTGGMAGAGGSAGVGGSGGMGGSTAMGGAGGTTAAGGATATGGTGGTTSTTTTTTSGSGGSTGSGNAMCPTDQLSAGAEADGLSTEYSTLSTASVRVNDLTEGTLYGCAVAAFDLYRNTSTLSNVECGTPEPLEQSEIPEDFQGCFCTAAGRHSHQELALLSLMGLLGTLLMRRRKERA